MASLKEAAIRGSIWTFTGYGIGNILRLASNVILTRLLVPEMFGVMSLITTFIIGLTLFSDIGIRPSIIQNKRGTDPDFFNTAWSIQIIRGCLLWFACLLIAWPVAEFYNEKQLLWLVPIVGASMFIDGFCSIALITLNRTLSLGKLTIFEISVQIVSITVMIAWAWFSPTIWALVAGNIASSLIKALWSHRLIPNFHNCIKWDKSAAQEIFSFGKWIFISTVMMFLANQSDKLILGKLFTMQMLGVYSIAFQISILPQRLISQFSIRIMFPIVSIFNSIPRERLKVKISEKRFLLLVGLLCLVAVLVSFGDLFIQSLYDERYVEASWMLVLLSCGLWPRILILTANPVLMAIGKPLYSAFANSINLLYIIVFLPLGYYLKGPVGAIVAISCSDIFPYLIFNYGLWREGLLDIQQDVCATLILIGLIILFCLGRLFFNLGIPFAGIPFAVL